MDWGRSTRWLTCARQTGVVASASGRHIPSCLHGSAPAGIGATVSPRPETDGDGSGSIACALPGLHKRTPSWSKHSSKYCSREAQHQLPPPTPPDSHYIHTHTNTQSPHAPTLPQSDTPHTKNATHCQNVNPEPLPTPTPSRHSALQRDEGFEGGGLVVAGRPCRDRSW